MDEHAKMPVDGYEGKDVFEHGNVRIIISEHFSEKGKSFESIIEDSIVREAKTTADAIPDRWTQTQTGINEEAG